MRQCLEARVSSEDSFETVEIHYIAADRIDSIASYFNAIKELIVSARDLLNRGGGRFRTSGPDADASSDEGASLMKMLPMGLVAAVFAGAAVSAHADTVTLSGITASWLNPAPTGAIDGTAGQGTANPTIAWGGNGASTLGQVGGDSGYGFAAVATASGTVPPSPSPDFSIGTFTHYNQPIGGSSITGVDLSISADITVGAIDEGMQTFLFHFIHTETPNGSVGDPCPDGGTAGTGVDVNGCADHVQISSSTLSSTFMVGSDAYTLNIIGFEQGGIFSNDFWTEEGANDSAQLIANVSLATTVPEPGMLALVGVSLLSAFGFSRRRLG